MTAEFRRSWLEAAAADGFVGAQAALGQGSSSTSVGPAEVSVRTGRSSRPPAKGGGPSMSGGNGKVWPQPIGREASAAAAAFEEIRERLSALSQWCDDEISANNLEAKIVHGLMTEARMQPHAAQAVAREIARLVGLIQDSALNVAAAAKLAGTKMVTMYEEPILEARAERLAGASIGLKVN